MRQHVAIDHMTDGDIYVDIVTNNSTTGCRCRRYRPRCPSQCATAATAVPEAFVPMLRPDGHRRRDVKAPVSAWRKLGGNCLRSSAKAETADQLKIAKSELKC